MYSNFSSRTIDLISNRERKVLCIYRQQSVLNLIYNKGGYRKEIWKRSTNTSVPVYVVSVVFSNFSGRTRIGSVIKKENYYGSIANHQYLIRYVIKVDIERRFGKVQGMNWYLFTWFLLCLWRITNKNGCNTDLGRMDPL